MRQELSGITKVVIKIGTNLITKNNQINLKYLKSLASQIAYLKSKKNIDFIIVSSGAIGLGIKALNLKKIPSTLPEKQAAAAVGQGHLMNIYNTVFKKKGLITAQILMTQDDFRDRLRYINAKNTLNTLISQQVIPIVNENDTISVDEIKFGDNDTLAAHITNLAGAELLILFTNVDGLMDYSNNKLIKEVEKIDDKIEGLIKKEKTELGTGGMATKLKAAEIINKSGEWMIIANGNIPNVITKIMEMEEIGTIFKPSSKKLSCKKRWIAFHQKVKGEVQIDEGAKNALLEKGKSLLPIGILNVIGSFQQGDLVSIDADKKEIARGIVNYSSDEIKEIKGLKTSDIAEKFKKDYYIEVIHRDNLVII